MLPRDKILAYLWPDADDERGPRTLAQALYALRKNLEAEDAITGAKEPRFDPALVSSDVSEFASAVARGDDERGGDVRRAVPRRLLHLGRRRVLSMGRTGALGDRHRVLAGAGFARTARAAGDTRSAVTWWRKLAGIEPLNARVTMGLMERSLRATEQRRSSMRECTSC